MGAISGPKAKEESALSMEQRSKDATLKGAQTKFKMGECAKSMEQRSTTNYAAVKDAQIKLKMEDCVKGMGQKSHYAAVQVARTVHKEQESVGRTVASHPNVVIPNAKIMPSKEEYV